MIAYHDGEIFILSLKILALLLRQYCGGDVIHKLAFGICRYMSIVTYIYFLSFKLYFRISLEQVYLFFIILLLSIIFLTGIFRPSII